MGLHQSQDPLLVDEAMLPVPQPGPDPAVAQKGCSSLSLRMQERTSSLRCTMARDGLLTAIPRFFLIPESIRRPVPSAQHSLP